MIWHALPMDDDRPPEELRVSTIELFFDLVFVFTLTQLTALLADDLSLEGALRVSLIFTVLYWMYGAYAWATNQVPPDRPGRQLFLVCGMAAFLVCALAIPQAFDRTGVIFGVGYLLVVVVHSALFAQVHGPAVLRFAPVNLVTALIVIWAGLAEGLFAYGLWIAVIAIHIVPPILVRRAAQLDIRAAHFVERHGLLLIVAFGESVIAIGIAIDPAQLDAGLLAVAVLTLILAAELWWVYFAHDAEQAEHQLASKSAADKVRAAHGGYFYAFIPTLLGVVSIAAGIKKSLGDFTEPLETPAALALAVGVALYLVGQAAFHWALRLGPVRVRLAAAVAAVATVALGVQLSAAAELIALTLLLAALIAFEARTTRRSWVSRLAARGDGTSPGPAST